MTDTHQTAVASALAKAYRITWPRQPYLVDAVGETGASSGFTHAPPSDTFAAHIHASVGSVRNAGDSALELLFHEASHVPAVGGEITRFIQAECKRQNLDVLPELWHFMIMFTSGDVTRRELARTGSPGYVPYIYRYNQLPPVVSRPSSDTGGRTSKVRQPLRRHWPRSFATRARAGILPTNDPAQSRDGH